MNQLDTALLLGRKQESTRQIRAIQAGRHSESVLKAHFHEPDVEAARALYAAVAAHQLSGQPVWVMLVAPPGSLKTELLEALYGIPRVHLIDSMTPKTFISGQIKEPGIKQTKSPSLLHRIGNSGIIAFPDFSTVLSMKAEAKAALLADMRRIYDGHFRKEYGTTDDPQVHEWEGRITLLVGATPDVDAHYSIFQTLGERFVMVRWPRPDGIKAALKAMNQDRQVAKEELRSAVEGLLTILPDIDPVLPEQIQMRIAHLAGRGGSVGRSTFLDE